MPFSDACFGKHSLAFSAAFKQVFWDIRNYIRYDLLVLALLCLSSSPGVSSCIAGSPPKSSLYSIAVKELHCIYSLEENII